MIRIDDIQIDKDFYNPLIHLLMNTTGLNLNYYQRNFIEKRIKSRMIRVNCDTLELYYKYLLGNPQETDKFLNCFNINYSVFFRNWEVFEQFENIILSCLYLSKKDIISDLKPSPERQYIRESKSILLNNKHRVSKRVGRTLLARDLFHTSLYKKIWNPSEIKRHINIWSCPCANGEEPYSIAMILDNLKNQVPSFPLFKITASDIDKDSIRKAKFGIYNEDNTKNVSKYYEYKYFIKKKENLGFSYSIHNNLKNYIEFIEEDITKGHQTSNNYDIVFCRYLLIYINRKVREKFLQIICNRLTSGGLLILGKTETLFNTQTDLKLIDSYNRIYMKKG
ncbi:MAG: CheR family methyltransferase [Promethearchaeota archaeon]